MCCWPVSSPRLSSVSILGLPTSRRSVIRSYTRAQFLRERADIDWTAVGAKVKHLIDTRIDASVRWLMAPVSILDGPQEARVTERGEIVFGEARIKYQVVRSPRRRKTIELTVDAPGVVRSGWGFRLGG